MNFYILTEGKTEKKVYKKWIPFINKNLKFVEYRDFNKNTTNSFVIYSGNGYPQIFSGIEAAFKDTHNNNFFNRFVFVIDSENSSYEQKKKEVELHINKYNWDNVEVKIIIQNFCIETWALANKKLIKNNYKDKDFLNDYYNHFDIFNNDPEILTPNPILNKNRAQFAYSYLRKILQEHNKSYNKSNPKAIFEKYYFDQIYKRYNQESHIKSFKDFIDAFK